MCQNELSLSGPTLRRLFSFLVFQPVGAAYSKALPMLDANYIKHFKIIGKICKLFDVAAADETALKALRATTYDQVADGTDASAEAVDIFASYRSRYNNAIENGPTTTQRFAIALASDYLNSDDFYADLTTKPTSRTATNVIAALETEMSAGVDDKTLTDLDTTGLVNFFNEIKGSLGTWNTEADGTADYKDSVYCVSAVI
jgi:hypothetical protein